MKKTFLTLIIAVFSLGAFAQKPYAAFNHIGLDVSNVDISAAFYSKILHLKSIKSPFSSSIAKWLSLGGGMQLHLIATKKEDLVISKDNHIAFNVASVEDFIAVLNKANIPYMDGDGKANSFNVRPDGVKQIYFKDPDGNLIEVNDAK